MTTRLRTVASMSFTLVFACDSGPTTPADRTSPVVASVSPGVDSTGVRVGATVTATFSEAVDPTTVTGATFTLTGPGGAVAGTVALAGNTATFTPSAPLTELASQYTAALTAGIRDRAGNALTPRTWRFTTVIVDPAYFYRMTNQFLTESQSLGTDASNSNRCTMSASSPTSASQRWMITVESGVYRLRTQAGGASLSLEGADGNGPCLLASGNFTGQHWAIIPSAAGWYKLQNANLGAARSLETIGGAGGTFVPVMAPTGNFSGQNWKFTRLPSL